MHFNLIKKLINCFIVGVFIISFHTTVFAGGSVTIKWGKDSGYEQPKVYKKHKKNGPPNHAPAHGYRAKYQYRYYPNYSVYYDTSRKLYFYLKGDNWEVGASLPSNLRMEFGDYVSLEMDTEKPYVHYNEHVKKFPPGQLKQKNQKTQAKKHHKK
jgi:hypothetical protein